MQHNNSAVAVETLLLLLLQDDAQSSFRLGMRIKTKSIRLSWASPDRFSNLSFFSWRWLSGPLSWALNPYPPQDIPKPGLRSKSRAFSLLKSFSRRELSYCHFNIPQKKGMDKMALWHQDGLYTHEYQTRWKRHCRPVSSLLSIYTKTQANLLSLHLYRSA